MATSTCIKCGALGFEAPEIQINETGETYRLFQCGTCGGVISVIETFPSSQVDQRLEQIEEMLMRLIEKKNHQA